MAAVYDALAGLLRSVGGDEFTARRQALTGALNTAYDELLTARSTATGLNRWRARLLGALNASHLMAESAVAVGMAGARPPPLVIDVVSRLADAIRTGSPPPMIPPTWSDSPAMLTLRDAMAGAARALSRDWYGAWPPARRTLASGQVSWMFTLRLMACMGVVGVVSEVLPLQRSYWVPLTVAIVFKPDYGSVFARALLGVLGTGERLTVLGRAGVVGLAVVGWPGACDRPTWSGWPDSNRRPPRPKRGALAKLRYSPYLAECSGCPAMFAVRTGGGPAVLGVQCRSAICARRGVVRTIGCWRTSWNQGFTASKRNALGTWRGRGSDCVNSGPLERRAPTLGPCASP